MTVHEVPYLRRRGLATLGRVLEAWRTGYVLYFGPMAKHYAKKVLLADCSSSCKNRSAEIIRSPRSDFLSLHF